MSSLDTSPPSQILLIFPSSGRMCVPHKIPGSLSDNSISVSTITWVETSSSELAWKFICSWLIIMRSATYQLPISTKLFVRPFQTLKQPFRIGMCYSQLKDLESKLEWDWVTCPDLKELTSVRPEFESKPIRFQSPFLCIMPYPLDRPLCLIFVSYEVASSLRANMSESSLIYLQAILK